MNAELRTYIESFSTRADDRGSVHVSAEPDLGVKFQRVEVCRGNNLGSNARLAMVLRVDGGPVDVIECDGDVGWSLHDTLIAARAAIELALEGCPKD